MLERRCHLHRVRVARSIHDPLIDLGAIPCGGMRSAFASSCVLDPLVSLIGSHASSRTGFCPASHRRTCPLVISSSVKCLTQHSRRDAASVCRPHPGTASDRWLSILRVACPDVTLKLLRYLANMHLRLVLTIGQAPQ